MALRSEEFFSSFVGSRRSRPMNDFFVSAATSVLLAVACPQSPTRGWLARLALAVACYAIWRIGRAPGR
jgi:hypothetical protein